MVYLIFNEGYSATAGDDLRARGAVRRSDPARAPAASSSCRRNPKSLGLLALMLLIDARREARVDAGRRLREARGPGSRRAGTARGIEEGQALLRACLARNQPGPYQLQAAINAVHSDARDADETDWRQILALYDQLMAIAPSPVVALNRAVVVAEIDGAEAGAAEWSDGLELAELPPVPRGAGGLVAAGGTRCGCGGGVSGRDRAVRERAGSGNSWSGSTERLLRTRSRSGFKSLRRVRLLGAGDRRSPLAALGARFAERICPTLLRKVVELVCFMHVSSNLTRDDGSV